MGLLQEALLKSVITKSGSEAHIASRLELAVEARKIAGKPSTGGLGIKEAVQLTRQIDQDYKTILETIPDYIILPDNT